MSRIKHQNHFTIQGWMYDLGIDNIQELVAYAIIFGFSQDEESEFRGSISYIEDMLMCSRHTAINKMQSLIDKGLIKKRQDNINGVLFNRYVAIVPEHICIGSAKSALGSQKSTLGSEATAPGSAENAPQYNNKVDNNIDNKVNNITSTTTPYSRSTNEDNIIEPIKKKSKKESLDLSFVAPEFGVVFEEWLMYKRERGESYKQIGAKAAYDKLVQLSGNDPDRAMAIVKQSEANNWAGLFQLKDNGSFNNNTDGTRNDGYRNDADRLYAESTAFLEHICALQNERHI